MISKLHVSIDQSSGECFNAWLRVNVDQPTREGFIAQLHVDVDQHPRGQDDTQDGNAEHSQGPAPT